MTESTYACHRLSRNLVYTGAHNFLVWPPIIIVVGGKAKAGRSWVDINRIAIVTLNGYHNYGNRLQNYALQEVLKSLGFTVETLVVDNLPSNSEGRARKLIEKVKTLKGKSISEVSRVVYAKVSDTIYKSEYKNSRMIRTEKFKEFTELYINETEYSISDNNIPEDIADRYDYFVVGSDQVWNPYYTKGSPIYFLGFAPRDSDSPIRPALVFLKSPMNIVNVYQRGLLDMEYLSVRENDGFKNYKRTNGNWLPVHVDPTLLLTKEQWLAISKQASNKPKGTYVLTYFLGGIPDEP